MSRSGLYIVWFKKKLLNDTKFYNVKFYNVKNFTNFTMSNDKFFPKGWNNTDKIVIRFQVKYLSRNQTRISIITMSFWYEYEYDEN